MTEVSHTFTFRTLAGTHTVEVQPNESDQKAAARLLNVNVRRIVIQTLNDESCVVIRPAEIYHDPRFASYRCPPGFLDLYRANLDKIDFLFVWQSWCH
jgi:hypothetical protein